MIFFCGEVVLKPTLSLRITSGNAISLSFGITLMVVVILRTGGESIVTEFSDNGFRHAANYIAETTSLISATIC